MADEKIQLNVAEGVSEIVYRTGTALPAVPPVKIAVNGLISAPAEFFVKRKPEIKSSHVVVDRTQRKIILCVDESNYYGTLIAGTLKYNAELSEFNINKNKLYTLKELTQLLRTRRMYFPDKEEHSMAISALNKFYAKMMIELKDADDRKGNSEKSTKRETELNSPLSFKLDIAIYEGQPKSKLFVDVLVDISDSQAKFWLESVDLIELEFKLAEEVINTELEKFGNEIVILEV